MIQLHQKVKVGGREGITVRKGKTIDKRQAWWIEFLDTDMIECHFEGEMTQLEPDRPNPPKTVKPPPQVETLLPLEDFNNSVALGESTHKFKGTP